MSRTILVSGVGQSDSVSEGSTGKIVVGLLLLVGGVAGAYAIYRSGKKTDTAAAGVGQVHAVLPDYNEVVARRYTARQLELARQRRRGR